MVYVYSRVLKSVITLNVATPKYLYLDCFRDKNPGEAFRRLGLQLGLAFHEGEEEDSETWTLNHGQSLRPEQHPEM
jgi:hypothetical protein